MTMSINYKAALLGILTLLIPSTTSRTVGAATATLPFEPLFTKPPTFVYTFDANTSAEVIALDGIEPGQADPQDRISRAYWISYADTDAVLVPTALALTEVTFMTAGRNLSLPDPSGAYGGCEGALGEVCSTGLINAFKKSLSHGSDLQIISDSFEDGSGQSPSPADISCPWDIFNNYVQDGSSLVSARLASENVKDTYLISGRNASSPLMRGIYYNVTAEQELNKIIISMIARTPISRGTRKDVNNIQLEIVCMRAKVVDPARDNPTATAGVSGGSSTETGSSAAPTNAASGLMASLSVSGIFSGVVSLLLVFV